MDSLLKRLDLDFGRKKDIQFARIRLMEFLLKSFIYRKELQKQHDDLDEKRNVLVARHLSGVRIPDYAGQLTRLSGAISELEVKLMHHDAEYRKCEPALGAYIFKLTGRGYFDSVEQFKADFFRAVPSMCLDPEELQTLNTGAGFLASIREILGDGNCLIRALLSQLALKRDDGAEGVVLPKDPPGMLEWIVRLKLLMCAHIQMIVGRFPDFEAQLLSIPANATVRSLPQYFAMFIRNGYNGTDCDCRILAAMFGTPIHVISKWPTEIENCQTFLPIGMASTRVDAIRQEHINIAYDGSHYDSIVEIFDCDLRPAVAP